MGLLTKRLESSELQDEAGRRLRIYLGFRSWDPKVSAVPSRLIGQTHGISVNLSYNSDRNRGVLELTPLGR